MSKSLRSGLVCFIKASIKLLAAKEDQQEISKHSIIPTVPFIEAKILKNPNSSIGIREYPTVLMIL